MFGDAIIQNYWITPNLDQVPDFDNLSKWFYLTAMAVGDGPNFRFKVLNRWGGGSDGEWILGLDKEEISKKGARRWRFYFASLLWFHSRSVHTIRCRGLGMSFKL